MALRALTYASIGTRTTPAPIWPMPASLCAIPVVTNGRIPVSTTLRTSMPQGAPAKSSAGKLRAGFFVTVISYISLLYRTASLTVPPANNVSAGEAANEQPPKPAVSVMALSPISGHASSCLKPGKNKPLGKSDLAVNQS